MNYDAEKDVTRAASFNGTSHGMLKYEIRAAIERAYAAGLEAGKAEARQGVPKTVDGMVARLAAWEPVVRAAVRAVDAGSLYAASDGVRGSDRDNAAGMVKATVRALAPEHRPAAGGGA